ncbi:hypothetical protein U9M48_029654 [Paspalum notatum var. saurae]|uniref:SP-RING-type domain-containing protein n=1 Tax=Paspalum notatum var. saurae TaxID=547442 RepID=A0AAQ3U210_PASNO
MTTAAAPAPHPTPPLPPEQPQPPKDQQQKALAMNAIRLKAIGDRIMTHMRGMGVLPVFDFAHLVYAFARGVDFAVSAGDIPQMAAEIPGILRKDWTRPVVQIDKNRNRVSSGFRYYPWLKFERLITSFEAKAGYDVLMADFFIERSLPRDEKIRLIVVQKENLDASSCITSPPHVSFLVNGKGVDRRTNVSLESGPQFPTDITKMLKYGANIIQAVGYFNANYVIAVAFVNNLASFSAPKLDDYAQPITVSPSDSDVLEGPSRVSLNCPISFRRIKTPIKGRLCKHYQCFDYDNYMEMNSRKPYWRCPFCTTPSNFTDLRIDQKMVKASCILQIFFISLNYLTSLFLLIQILEETRDDVIDVLVFADGSWKAAPDEKSDRHRGDADAIQSTGDAVETELPPSGVIDLINGNGDGDLLMDWALTSEDTKPVLNSQDLSVSDYLPDFPMAVPTEDQCLGDGNNGGSNMASRQNLLPPSSDGLGSSSFGTLESILPQNVLRPVITYAVSPSLETSSSTSGMQHVSQETHRETVQLQSQIGPVHGSEMRRLSIPRHPRREPVGVQALPVPPQNPGSSTRVQPNILNCPPPIPLSSAASSTYQALKASNLDSVIAPVSSGGGPLPRTPSAAASLHPQSAMRDVDNTSNHLHSRVGLPAPHLMGARQPPGISESGGANAYRPTPMQRAPTLEQLIHTRMNMNQTALAAVGQTTAAAHIRPTQVESQQSQTLRSQPVPRAATPSLQRAPPHLQPPSVPPAAPSTPQVGSSDGLAPEPPVDENWCPTGQMRGSLTGNAYSSAIRRYLGQSEQQQQGHARPHSASGARKPH